MLRRFIEGDFDAYVERIEKPYVWGGEPELLMASHVLKWVLLLFHDWSFINPTKYGFKVLMLYIHDEWQ